MKIIKIINEVLTEIMNTVWYHGTPDAREITQVGGFSTRIGNTEYISDPKRWHELQQEMGIARNNGNEDHYFNLLDQAGALRKQMQYKKPIFFTNNSRVANSYTNEKPAFDYQESEPKTFQVQINDSGKILQVPAKGERFRNLNADYVKKGLSDAGITDEEINNHFNMFPTNIRRGKMSAETIGIIAQQLGFDIVDIIGVLDSYHGGSVQSNVRMVFDPSRIKINNNLNENVNNIYNYNSYNDEDRFIIEVKLNNIKIGEISSEILFSPYEYEFDDVFTEEEYDEIFNDDDIVKISYVDIIDKYKYHGIGTILMNKMINHLKQQGHSYMYLNASPMGFSGLDLPNLIKFYEKFGFEVIKHQGHNALMVMKHEKYN